MKRIIVGNGIVGLASAFGLTQKINSNDEICIIGPKSRVGSATLAAAAMLNSFAEIEAGALESEIDLLRFELSHTATRMWPEFELALIKAAGDKIPYGCSKCEGCAGGGCFSRGTYVVNNTATDSLDDENFDAILAGLDMFSEQHDLISPSDIPGYKPQQRFRANRALLIHNEGWFNPRLMVEKMDAVLANAENVSFIDAKVDHLVSGSNGIEGCVLTDGTLVEGDQFLLATGATVSGLIDRSDIELEIQGVFYGIGTSIEVRSPDAPLSNVIRTPNRGLACGLYAAPYFNSPDEPNNHVLVGASNFIAAELHQHGRLASVEGLVSGAMSQINSDFYRADLIRVNVGARPASQDGYPMLGRTALENLFMVSGTKRDGFHMAPLISDMMSTLMTGGKYDSRFDCFAPDRELIRNMTREEAVTKTARHQMSAAYQHGFMPASNRMPEQMMQGFRDAAEKLHDQVGVYDWGIPPEMLDMYRYGHAKP